MKRMIAFAISVILTIITLAQNPQGISYQAIVRNNEGNAIANQNISLRISLQDQGGSNIYYRETHTLQTNSYGLANIIIGGGNVVSGTFSIVPWSIGDIYLKLEVDPSGGSSYSVMGTTKLQSVPFALHAQSASEINTHTANEDDPIFVVRNNAGQIVFAVYQTGVRVYVEDGNIKSTKGGFAVGGLSDQTKENETEFLRVTSDSVRINFMTPSDSKSTKGGFAVGGLSDQTKLPTRNMLFIAPDSARIWVNSEAAKGTKGGFAVGGFTNNKTASNFILLTPENYLIGHEAGFNTTTGLYNSFFGYQSGYSNTEGSFNVFMGRNTGFSNLSGNQNVFIGDNAGSANQTGYANVFLGNGSGLLNQSGFWNIFLGRNSGYSNNSGYANFFAGDFAGFNNTSGYYNVFIGDYTGGSNTEGSRNVFIGKEAGWSNTTGVNNIFVGSSSGYSNNIGNWNVFMGENSGYSNTTGVSNVAIGQSAGLYLDTASYNVFLGTLSGFSNYGGKQNVFLGQESGYSNSIGSFNVFTGSNSGYNNINGISNIFTGSSAGFNNTSGNYNVFSGTLSGFSNTEGAQNAFYGQESGKYNTTGSWNVIIGTQSGFNNTSGHANVIVGDRAGYSNSTGNANVFIGQKAGYYETGSNKLYIANSENYPPLLYGDFSTGRIGLGTTSPIEKLHVAGNAYFDVGTYKINIDYFGGEPTIRPSSGNWGYIGTSSFYWYQIYTTTINRNNEYTFSDSRIKTNLKPLDSSLSKVLALHGYSYSLDLTKHPAFANRENTKQWEIENIGFIAQDLMKVVPEMVVLDKETGLYMIRNYEQLLPVITEAIKEQQQIIDNQNDKLESIGYKSSDRRWKSNIVSLDNSLQKITKLNGVSFNWRVNEFPKKDFKPGTYIGFIAQDVEKVIPEIVSTDKEGYKSIDYAVLAPHIVEAIKEQQKLIEQQNQKISKIEKENNDLKTQLAEIKANIDKLLMNKTSKTEQPPTATKGYKE